MNTAPPAIHRTDYVGAHDRAPLLGVLASHLSFRASWWRAVMRGTCSRVTPSQLATTTATLFTYDEDGHPV